MSNKKVIKEIRSRVPSNENDEKQGNVFLPLEPHKATPIVRKTEQRHTELMRSLRD